MHVLNKHVSNKHVLNKHVLKHIHYKKIKVSYTTYIMKSRVVMHVDFDYFYAQCEEIRNPLLKTKPVCVCVYSDRGNDSGAIATANYVARKYGVKSGMPITFAKRKLNSVIDDAEFIPVDFDYYTQISEESMNVISAFADVFEYVGRDEAYLDVSKRIEHDFQKAAKLAQQIKYAVKIKTKIGCSIGISPNRMISKIASDFKKPDGLTVVKPEQIDTFLEPLKIRDIPYIGKKTEHRLLELNFKTISDLRKPDLFLFTKEFGKKNGTYIYNAARGINNEPVKKKEPRLQHGRITTLSEDSKDYEFLKDNLNKICLDVHNTVIDSNQTFKSVSIQIIQSDLTAKSKSKMLKNSTANIIELQKCADYLLKEMLKTQQMPIRRIGIRVTELSDVKGQSDITSFF